jgi:hypothetical protein
MPVVLATWEAEMRKIMVPGQPGLKNFDKTPSPQKKVGCGIPIIPVMSGSIKSWSRPAWANPNGSKRATWKAGLSGTVPVWKI